MAPVNSQSQVSTGKKKKKKSTTPKSETIEESEDVSSSQGSTESVVVKKKRAKSVNYLDAEQDELVRFCKEHFDLLEGSFSATLTAKMKVNKWKELTTRLAR